MVSSEDETQAAAFLLRVAAASVGDPQRRARVAKWLTAILLVIGEEPPQPPAFPPAAKRAVEELLFSLDMANDHAAAVAEQFRVT